MTPEQFTYWLQGYFELRQNKEASIDREQVKVIQDHLDLVFNKVTPGNVGVSTRKGVFDQEVFDRLCGSGIESVGIPSSHSGQTYC